MKNTNTRYALVEDPSYKQTPGQIMPKLHHKPLKPTASSRLMGCSAFFFVILLLFLHLFSLTWKMRCSDMFRIFPYMFECRWGPVSVDKKSGSSSTNLELKFAGTWRYYIFRRSQDHGIYSNHLLPFFIFALVMWTSNGNSCEIMQNEAKHSQT